MTLTGNPNRLFSVEQIEERLLYLDSPLSLFAGAKDWALLRERLQNDSLAGRIFREVRRRVDGWVSAPALVHVIEGTKCLVSARLFEARMIDLATMARIENDARYAVRAREELLVVAALPDWGAHFLAVAEYALGVAIGLNWLHDFLSESDRNTIADALLERALRPSFGSGHFVHWLGGNNNLVQVNHAGLTAAALAIADREPELAARTLSRAILEQAGPNALYAPDGVYPEGAMYWTYGTTFEVILITLLEHAFGTDFGLADFPGFLASADYLAQVTAPTGQYFDYGDCRPFPPPQPVLHWFAAKWHRPEIASREWLRMEGKTPPPIGELPAVYERFDALALWWRQPAEKFEPAASLPLNWLGRGGNPVAIFRSAWNDSRAIFVGIKGGSPSSSHAHMDAGSFVLEADGVRWAVDAGMQDYQTNHAAGLRLWDGWQTGDRWRVFRLSSDAHNILRLDNKPQRVQGVATFVSFQAETPHAILDLTSLYDAESVRRGVRLLPDRRVIFRDEWTARSETIEVTFQWLTHADLIVTEQTIILQQSGEELTLRIYAAGTLHIEIVDLSKTRQSFDEENPGLRCIRMTTSTEAGQSGFLTIVAEPASAKPVSEDPHQPLSLWTAPTQLI